MGVPKRRPVLTVKERQEQDRVMRARKANPPRDPSGEHHEAIAEIARAVGVDVSDMLDDWDHRAAVMEYDGYVSRAEAERIAVEDIRAMYVRQGKLAL